MNAVSETFWMGDSLIILAVAVDQALLRLPGIRGDVRRLQQPGNDDHPPRPSREDAVEVLQFDPADAKDRDAHRCMNTRDVLQSDRGPARLGRRGKERPE